MMIVEKNTAINFLSSHEGEFAEVKNPSYIYPPVEYYPLSQKLKSVNHLKAALMDMDGTTTTTEVLCIYSLEEVVRKMSGKLTRDEWKGVDHEQDLSHIIGNSTTKHVEYLLDKYGEMLKSLNISREFLRAAHWTLTHGMDTQRKAEVAQNLRNNNIPGAINDIRDGMSEDSLFEKYSQQINSHDFGNRVNMGIDIYYETYHRILALLKEGKSQQVRMQVFGEPLSEENMISPMPGIAVLLPLIKGWLGEEAGVLAETLIGDYEKSTGRSLTESQKKQIPGKLQKMGVAFENQPLKLGLVTSSIFYEANIVIQEVLKVVKKVIEDSSLSDKRKKIICNACDDYHQLYDAFVTASDSSEIRLKPHRDLYSIALHKTGMLPPDFDKCIGFEDSESGTVAIRAAGIGCCIAVPFAETSGHNLKAASHILKGGVPEAIIDHNLFSKNMTVS